MFHSVLRAYASLSGLQPTFMCLVFSSPGSHETLGSEHWSLQTALQSLSAKEGKKAKELLLCSSDIRKNSGNQTGFLQPVCFMPPAPNTSTDEGYLWSLFCSVQLNPSSHAASVLINHEIDTLSQRDVPSAEMQDTDMQQNTLGPQHGILPVCRGPTQWAVWSFSSWWYWLTGHNGISLHFRSSSSFQTK